MCFSFAGFHDYHLKGTKFHRRAEGFRCQGSRRDHGNDWQSAKHFAGSSNKRRFFREVQDAHFQTCLQTTFHLMDAKTTLPKGKTQSLQFTTRTSSRAFECTQTEGQNRHVFCRPILILNCILKTRCRRMQRNIYIELQFRIHKKTGVCGKTTHNLVILMGARKLSP